MCGIRYFFQFDFVDILGGRVGREEVRGKREVVRMGSMVVLLDFLIFTCGLSGSRMCVAF